MPCSSLAPLAALICLCLLLGCGGTANESYDPTTVNEGSFEGTFCCPEPSYVPVASGYNRIDISDPLVNGEPHLQALEFLLVDEQGQPIQTIDVGAAWEGVGTSLSDTDWQLRVSLDESVLPCDSLNQEPDPHTLTFNIDYVQYDQLGAPIGVAIVPVTLTQECVSDVTMAWSPWVPNEGEDVALSLDFTGPCVNEARYQLDVFLGASFNPPQIVIPAGQVSGTSTLSGLLSGAPTFFVTEDILANPSCSPVSGAPHVIVVHPAGDALFDTHAGPVQSPAGAQGTLSVLLDYSLRNDPMSGSNRALWKLEYVQTTPVAFTMNIDVEASSTREGTWDGPDGEYAWRLTPHAQTTYSGTLLGVLEITRPDSTLDRLQYALTTTP